MNREGWSLARSGTAYKHLIQETGSFCRLLQREGCGRQSPAGTGTLLLGSFWMLSTTHRQLPMKNKDTWLQSHWRLSPQPSGPFEGPLLL